MSDKTIHQPVEPKLVCGLILIALNQKIELNLKLCWNFVLEKFTKNVFARQVDICSATLMDVIHSVIHGTDGSVFCFGHQNLGKHFYDVFIKYQNNIFKIILIKL